MYFLAQTTVFKNEAHVLDEFMQHYIAQGVEHFWLVDNGSTDCYQRVLANYADHYTLFSQPKMGKIQTASYKKFVLPLARNLTQWLLVIDADEFVYAREGRTIAGALAERADRLHDVLQICMLWKVFGTSQHEEQPACLVNSLTKRYYYGPHEFKSFGKKPLGHQNLFIGKCLVNMRLVSRIMIHVHIGTGRTVCADMSTSTRKVQKAKCQPSQCMNEIFHRCRDVDSSKQALHLNHYKFQSAEFMSKVKGTRGRADGNFRFGVLGEFQYLQQFTNSVNDTELRDMRLTTCRTAAVKPLELVCPHNSTMQPASS